MRWTVSLSRAPMLCKRSASRSTPSVARSSISGGGSGWSVAEVSRDGVPSRSRRILTAAEISRRVRLPTPRSRESTPHRHGEQVFDGEDVGPIQGVGGPGAQAQLGDRRIVGRGGQQLAELGLVGLVGNRTRLVDVLEALPPGREHLLGIVEPLGDVRGGRPSGRRAAAPSRRPGSNASGLMVISVPGGRCEGSVVPSPHCGKRARGQLVERHGGGVALGVQVPARRLAQRQQRVEVAGGPGADVLGRRAGEREIEEHDVQLVAPAHHAHRDVVRLDVAVRDALFLQVVDHVQQVFAEALQEVDVQAGPPCAAAGRGSR